MDKFGLWATILLASVAREEMDEPLWPLSENIERAVQLKFTSKKRSKR
jgi:hypothetical protein